MQFTRRQLVRGLRASLPLVLSGCSENRGPPHSRDELEEEHAVAVEMGDVDFLPETVTITTGESVVWFTNDNYEHTVTAYENEIPDGAEYFASGGHESEQAARKAGTLSGGLADEDTYSHTFDVPGEYEYFCLPHEQRKMIGTVVVEE